MSFLLIVALALALGFLRTGLAQDERCVDLMKDSSCQSDGPRFFYNSTSSRCQRLAGGCGSNRNTFKTLESCATLCHTVVCYRPVEYGAYPPIRFSHHTDNIGKPKDTTVNFYFYNVSSGSCEGFHFRGSASNGNIFWTVKECESLCGDVKERCVDLMMDSSCQSDGPRFFYNSTRSRCQRLVGGCGSNRNTFKTLESCQDLCYGNATTSSPLTEDPGRPLSEDPGNSDFNILFGIIVLMVVFMVIVTFVAIVVLVVQYCRRASSNGYRLLGSGP
ncbi:hypothetical protein PFLUV_G00015520 [Perca fluviatilis]|uniref:BPTI/Kunitz inhibitor domain-containing protein n=1 Tax=Perca fluviatilis TaxID=8168 RepID=A0A6A5FG85_PERFL|nr:carboxypeptidase inhibitor SmCI-like [Perca fluviatilis]KAF1393420.1 hypothetical protein PFLUV_G00015520 [Perca fluviatilis]